MEERWGAVHKQQNLLDPYEAGQRHDKCQDSGLSVPAGGARGRMSRKQQPERVRGTGRTSQHSTAGLGWTSSSGLWQPHAASFIPTCCLNGNLLHLLASLLPFHRPSLYTHAVYVNLLNYICIFLGEKKSRVIQIGLFITFQN